MFTLNRLKVGAGVALAMFTTAMIVAPFVADIEVVGGWWESSIWWVWRGGW